jgi:ABC-type multidrug transport system permease subunit
MLLFPLPLYSWENGAFIMTVIFGIVIAAIIGAVYMMMKNDQNKLDK